MDVLYATLFALTGLAVGLGYFALMRHSLIYLAGDRKGVLQFVSLALLRVVLFGGSALGAAHVSTWCLITYVVGFVVARTIAVARARSASGFSRPGSESRTQNG